jgi:N-acetylmuramoyl-L-alanine amidase
MKSALGWRLALFGLLGASISGLWNPATAAVRFDQREVDQNRVIAIAAPVGTASHQLLILEQLSNSRPCWRESGNNPTQVEPLLLNFDFTNICSRSLDSNGYSLRADGDDLGLQYSLRIVQRDNDLVLIATSNRDRTSPPIEIGRAGGYSDGFVRINLNPGWRMTKRVYNGQPIGHIYLSNNQDLPTLIAAAGGASGGSATTTPLPPVVRPPVAVTPTPAPSPSPGAVTPIPPDNLPSVAVRPSPSNRPPSTSSPSSGTRPSVISPGSSLPTPPRLPASSSSPVAANSNLNYQVLVQADTPEQQQRVRAIAPGAFRTVLDGRTVMQAGLFRNQQTAYALRQQLGRENLLAWVATMSAQSQPTPAPMPPVATPGSGSPQVPRGRMVVVIDPGHGGSDPGAVGVGGLQEKDVVFPISQQVATLLEQQGIQAILTRRSDRTIDLAPRVAIAEQANANLFVSIHANSAGASANGVETYYYGSSEGQQLAQSIQSNIIRSTGMIDRGVKTARFYVLTQTSMPAALVEVGFVTGRDDARRLSNASSRNQIAGAITRGILQYIQQNYPQAR